MLADLLDVKRDEWRSAVEGYLGNNKLNLVVAPKYARTALEIYGELDKKEYFNVAVLDTEKASQNQPQVQKGALSEEVTVRESHLRPYMDPVSYTHLGNTGNKRRLPISLMRRKTRSHSTMNQKKSYPYR